MSRIAEQAQVAISQADFAIADPTGKANIIGQGAAVLGFVPEQALTNRFSLIVDVRLPVGFSGAEFPLEIALLDEHGALVLLPGPAAPQPFRVAQVVQVVSNAQLLGQRVADHLGVSMRAVFDFSTGLPLALSALYSWRVQLDGDEEHAWTYPFAVQGPPPPPVFG